MSNSLSQDDVDSIHTILSTTYSNSGFGSALVVDGYGVRLAVERNHLVIADGIGAYRRVRTLTRSQRAVKRLVILGDSGTISLAAIRWCVETGINLTQVNSEGRILAETTLPGPREARLRRAQALAATNTAGLEAATHLIALKLHGHARNLKEHFGAEGEEAAAQLHVLTADAGAASDIAHLRLIEARGAAIYFGVWARNVAAAFATRDAGRVPSHWQTGNSRTSRRWQAGRSPRKATDPVNALLNYAYSLAEVECRIACIAVGLDPALGVMHADVKHRESMALDLLEAIRPDVEMTVLELLRVRKFRSVDFIETPDGTCRLTGSVTHPLTEAMADWARKIAPTAEHVAHIIGATSTTRVRTRTPLTKDSYRNANQVRAIERIEGGAHRPAKAPEKPVSLSLPTCVDCGTYLTSKRAKRCGACDALNKVVRMTSRADLGREVRHSATIDPAQTPEARKARIAGITASRAARDAWDAEHDVLDDDRRVFAEEVLPGLTNIPLQRIADAIGVSIASASTIRSGKLFPHARHWAALSELVKTNQVE